ncbi:MAG: hypothetical protein EHM28_09850 [Spirochaetaceae bacterium]|nr:MAG: hypothetical protein EHM28_09850 [Spirochaetaceae bacterium]
MPLAIQGQANGHGIFQPQKGPTRIEINLVDRQVPEENIGRDIKVIEIVTRDKFLFIASSTHSGESIISFYSL